MATTAGNAKAGKVAAGAPSSPSSNESAVTSSDAAVPGAVGAFAPEAPIGLTRTDDNVNKPSTTAPGEAPADTMDPNERVSTVPHQPDEEAIRVGTVNAVLVNPALPTAAEVARNRRGGGDENGQDRVETYPATRPNGEQVTVKHNVDTGETTLA
jgi:hypothetical protein